GNTPTATLPSGPSPIAPHNQAAPGAPSQAATAAPAPQVRAAPPAPQPQRVAPPAPARITPPPTPQADSVPPRAAPPTAPASPPPPPPALRPPPPPPPRAPPPPPPPRRCHGRALRPSNSRRWRRAHRLRRPPRRRVAVGNLPAADRGIRPARTKCAEWRQTVLTLCRRQPTGWGISPRWSRRLCFPFLPQPNPVRH